MKRPIDLNDPIAVLLAVIQAFEQAGIESAAYGGLALAAYGEPRETKDVDLTVAGVSSTQGEAALRVAGFDVVVAFDKIRFGGQDISRLTLIGGEGGSLNTVDMVEPRSPRYARQILMRSISGTLREQTILVISPEDFVVMKILATRDRDLEDAATVLRALETIDMKLIEGEIAGLAAEIADHDVPGRWIRARQMTGK